MKKKKWCVKKEALRLNQKKQREEVRGTDFMEYESREEGKKNDVEREL